MCGTVELTVGSNFECEGVREDLNFDDCVFVLSKVYNLFMFALGDLKSKDKRLDGCIDSEEDSDMGCTLSKNHDFIIVLNIKNIYSCANLICLFLHALTHVIQKPHFGHGFHEFMLTNAHLISCLYYLIARQNCNCKLFPEWNRVCATVRMNTSNVR